MTLISVDRQFGAGSACLHKYFNIFEKADS